MTVPLTLASASPRRKELLSQLWPSFAVIPADIDETPHVGEQPRAHVTRLAQEKALTVSALHPHTLVLAADTIVVARGEILGKPENDQDAFTMLGLLSGQEHQVMTAISVAFTDKVFSQCVETQVWFRPLSNADITEYWATGEPADKAGAYGIQGLGGRFVERINGSYSAVVGLPLVETEHLLQQAQQTLVKQYSGELGERGIID
ncbi:septum formation inhibitor Maf [Corallincola holothuriorum]|uniref:dTTP/UTP pyrophosphatase n=1 Tax=Corallincola holothuriorum TaxID=2282215 RepID=A0A368NK99_9GAMM|nr:septum formation inhibitor Maf [Corallincola holothuriorum]